MRCAGCALGHKTFSAKLRVPQQCRVALLHSPHTRKQRYHSRATAGLNQQDCTATRGEQYLAWKWGAKVHYRSSGVKGSAILLVHGFGVGSYQFQRVQKLLAQQHRVWSLDLLGQGLSWPPPAQFEHAESEHAQQGEELRLDIETWTEQLIYFVKNVIGSPCYVAGNSLGGLLAASFAAACPEYCRGVVYLNATPFWSVMPRLNTPAARAVRAVLGWDGALPAPARLKRAAGRAWAAFAREDNVRRVLQQVYSHKAAADDELVNSIMEAAQHPLALDAIASMWLSPATARPFAELAAAAAAACPACLIYGREDPWVVPLWGQRLKRLLPPNTAYYEVSPAGHCPHHEAPEAVHACLSDWVAAQDAGRAPSLGVGDQLTVTTHDGRRVIVTHIAGQPRTLLERAEAALHRVSRRLRRHVLQQALPQSSRPCIASLQQ